MHFDELFSKIFRKSQLKAKNNIRDVLEVLSFFKTKNINKMVISILMMYKKRMTESIQLSIISVSLKPIQFMFSHQFQLNIKYN